MINLKKLQNLELVIFDLDGTLIDSNGVNNEIDVELVRSMGEAKSSEEIIMERDSILKIKNMGDIYLNYCEYLRKKYNSNLLAEEILKLRRNISRKFLKDVKYKENADMLIKYLKDQNIKIALATVSSRETLNIYLNENEHMRQKCDLQKYFDFIVTKDDVILKKPNPEVYNIIIDKFKINDLTKCLVIEDSLSGIIAAKKAQIPVIAIYDKYSDNDREKINRFSDYNVKNYKMLIELLNKIKGEEKDDFTMCF